MIQPFADARRGGVLYEMRRAIVLFFLRLSGWKTEGALPDAPKYVVIAAPHTSNWDLPIMLAVAYHFRARLRWMGKDDLFKGPFGWLMRALGGIPVDRSKANNLVAATVEAIRAASAIALVVPPEGTRAKVRTWKTGFYHIAHGAGVPIALGFLDYHRKVGGFGPTFIPTGDFDSDMKIIKAFYAPIKGKFEDRFGESGQRSSR